jgi:phage host-nuclease inhibitor protein Gam
MARPRKATATLASLPDCTEAMRKLLIVTTELERTHAERDAAVARLTKTYQPDLNRLNAQKADLELQLQQYYFGHLAEVERDGKKSIELVHGVMGRRLAPSALKLLNKAWTWAAVLVALRQKFGDRFLRKREPEVDKEAVKDGLPETDLAAFGLKLEQEESFYIELQRPEDV